MQTAWFPIDSAPRDGSEFTAWGTELPDGSHKRPIRVWFLDGTGWVSGPPSGFQIMFEVSAWLPVDVKPPDEKPN